MNHTKTGNVAQSVADLERRLAEAVATRDKMMAAAVAKRNAVVTNTTVAPNATAAPLHSAATSSSTGAAQVSAANVSSSQRRRQRRAKSATRGRASDNVRQPPPAVPPPPPPSPLPPPSRRRRHRHAPTSTPAPNSEASPFTASKGRPLCASCCPAQPTPSFLPRPPPLPPPPLPLPPPPSPPPPPVVGSLLACANRGKGLSSDGLLKTTAHYVHIGSEHAAPRCMGAGATAASPAVSGTTPVWEHCRLWAVASGARVAFSVCEADWGPHSWFDPDDFGGVAWLNATSAASWSDFAGNQTLRLEGGSGGEVEISIMFTALPPPPLPPSADSLTPGSAQKLPPTAPAILSPASISLTMAAMQSGGSSGSGVGGKSSSLGGTDTRMHEQSVCMSSPSQPALALPAVLAGLLAGCVAGVLIERFRRRRKAGSTVDSTRAPASGKSTADPNERWIAELQLSKVGGGGTPAPRGSTRKDAAESHEEFGSFTGASDRSDDFPSLTAPNAAPSPTGAAPPKTKPGDSFEALWQTAAADSARRKP